MRTLNLMMPALAMACALLLLPAAAHAQGRSAADRLAGRVSEPLRQELSPLVDSARAEGLPTDALVERALEGASKRAPDDRILSAVRRLRTALGASRRALGSSASPAEVEAGASALQAGASSAVLAGIRRERPHQASLTVPLSVLADLVVRGVPVDTAAHAVLALTRGGDAVLVAYRRDVERDIAVGALPAAAASLRAVSFGNGLTMSDVPV
ncbi:MAG TPA: hypothetical protein VHQ45_13580, partial [Gemmatimonadaceae bacterium]|nr:hypothetical protein [Gemmatimonadaceae bacterium]